MKKILLTSLFMGNIFLISFGQNQKPFTKENFLTGGSFSFDIEKSKNIDLANTNLSGTYTRNIKRFETDFYFGYFIIDHLAIGFKTDIFLGVYKGKFSLNESIIKYYNQDLSIGPLIRYYLNSGIFFEGFATIGLLKFRVNDDNEKWGNYSFSTGIGYSLFLTKSVAIEPKIKYDYLNRPPNEIDDSKEITNGLNFAIGLQIYLKTKKFESQ